MGKKRPLNVLLALLALAVAGSIAATGVGATSSSPAPTQVSVADNVFKPKKVTIKPGQQVKWVWDNANLGAHNVTLFKGPKGVKTKHFTSGDAAHHFSFTRKFTVAGKYQFVCTIHPGMGMRVVVKKK